MGVPGSFESAGRLRRPKLSQTITRWALALHIYVSMGGFLLLFLFAVTGITLNHADFGLSEPRVEARTLELPSRIVADPTEAAVVAHLREHLAVRMPVTSYREYPDEIEVLFAAPGRRAQVFIDRTDGVAQAEIETRGLMGVIGDLHKGRDSGRVWFWIIDLTAILFVITSVTGMVTLASLRARRRAGFLWGLAGAVAAFVLYLMWVPR